MKKVLLVNPPFFSSPDSRLRLEGSVGYEMELGLLYLASFLESRSIEASFLDMTLYKDAENRLKNMLKSDFDLVGITAYTNSIGIAAKIARIIKECSASKVVIGGQHASALPVQTLMDFSDFDYLVYGQGEETLYELAIGEDISGVRGLVYRKDGAIIQNAPRESMRNLDQLPFPARHLLDIDRYVPLPANYRTLPWTGMLSARGCFSKCTFCSRSASRLEGRVEFRSIENIMAEIEECIDKYNIHDFRFYDDAFTIPRGRIIEFCQECKRKGLKITWNCYARVDMIDTQVLRLMKEAGCYLIKYGVEFGTQKWLDETKKNTTLRQAEEAVYNTKKAGIAAEASFMIGMPGEAAKEIGETIFFAKKLAATYTNFYRFDLLPGSELYNKKDSLPPALDNSTLNKFLKEAYIKIYSNPRFIAERLAYIMKNFSFHQTKALIKGAQITVRRFKNCR